MAICCPASKQNAPIPGAPPTIPITVHSNALQSHPMRLAVILALCTASLFAQSAPPVEFSCSHPGPVDIRVSPGVLEDLVTKRVDMECTGPCDAELHTQGYVSFDLIVNKKGEPCSVRVRSGSQALTPSAIEAIRQWRFKPYLLHGEPHDIESIITLTYPPPPPTDDKALCFKQPVDGRLCLTEEMSTAYLFNPKAPSGGVLDDPHIHLKDTVVLKVLIDEHGDRANITVLSGHSSLHQIAIDTVRQWHYFPPFLFNGNATPIETQVHLYFNINTP